MTKELSKNKMIGLFGGTFDPIHYGHLRTVLEVQQAHQLEVVHFMPLNIAVHRQQPSTANTLRWKMLTESIQNIRPFIADDRELKKDQPSYTVETLQSLKADIKQKTIVLIMGSDAFNQFETWKDPHKILELAHIVVMRRPDHVVKIADFCKHQESINKAELKHQSAGLIYIQTVRALDISSTDIRQLIANQQKADFLLPPCCLDIIKKNNLYQKNIKNQ